MNYVITPPEQASLAIVGSEERFPVRRVFCVGRNYAAHAREMGKDPDREPPFFFMKPADAVLDAGASIPYPPDTSNLHYEIELVIALGTGGSDIAEADALKHIWGAGVGIDLTRRDLQQIAKEAGRPWDLGKGFDQSAPIGPLTPMADVPSLSEGRIWLSKNGEIAQDADIADMIWSIEEQVAFLSRTVTLAPGDLIMTGTPAGVGPVVAGDTITGGVAGLTDITIPII